MRNQGKVGSADTIATLPMFVSTQANSFFFRFLQLKQLIKVTNFFKDIFTSVVLIAIVGGRGLGTIVN